MCDGGSENKGMVNDYLQELEIEKIVAQKDIRFSNSMVEAVNKRIKYDFLYRRSFDSLQTLQDYLPELIEQYNSKPHSGLLGFTPDEVFAGEIPSSANFLAKYRPKKANTISKKQEFCKTSYN